MSGVFAFLATIAFDLIYLVVSLILLTFAALFVLAISRRNVLAFAPIILIAPAIWGMVQWRCKSFGGYACGHGLAQGVSWHFWASLAILVASFASVSIIVSWKKDTSQFSEFSKILLASRALAGLWAYIIWQEIPFQSIHPPTLGGLCTTPLICHDVPFWGRGAGFWWVTPFFVVTVIGIARYARDVATTRTNYFTARPQLKTSLGFGKRA